MSKTITLKTWPRFFKDVKSGVKTFEIRKNDRPEGRYEVGDILILREYDNLMQEFTDSEPLVKRVAYVLDEIPYVPEGYVCMSIADTGKDGV
jgi:uncharacterized protein YqfB (UPF0267 family)